MSGKLGCKINGETVAGPIFVRPVKLLKKGDFIPGHTHDFAHTTIFMIGTIRVICYDANEQVISDREFTAPDLLVVDKDIRHELRAVSDGAEAWCVFDAKTSTK